MHLYVVKERLAVSLWLALFIYIYQRVLIVGSAAFALASNATAVRSDTVPPRTAVVFGISSRGERDRDMTPAC